MPLPTFVVIGAAKGGTTSLHHYLRQHPDVFMARPKETNFFWSEAAEHGRRTPRTLDEYERRFRGARDGQAIGEISPQYLNSATAAARIQHDLPDAKLVVSLRNPVDRAWSDYLGRVRVLRESRPFPDAIAPGEPCFEWGFYHPRLKRYYDRFPPDQVQVLLYDDLVADPGASMRQLFASVGVDPDFPVDTTRVHNHAAAPRSSVLNRLLWPAVAGARHLLPPRRRDTGMAARALALTYRPPPPFPPDLREQLRERYRDDVLATGELIGRDLSHWMSAA